MAIVEKNKLGKEVVVFSDCIRTNKKLSHPERLAIIARSLDSIIEEYKPTALSVETIFFENNQKTAMLVAEARGVILLSGSVKNIPVYEYSPLQIKVATTGDGRADKKQMIAMIPRLVSILKEKMLDDEFDAIAIALTCLASVRHKVPQLSP